MSTDDQLFKRDGLLVTDIDILILMLSRGIANLFTDEDDETYTSAYRKIMKAGVRITVTLGVCSIILTGWNMGLTGGVIAIFIACCFHIFFSTDKCDGRGTNIPLFSKVIFLALIAIKMLNTTNAILMLQEGSFINLGEPGTAMLFFVYFYMSRLGGRPPNKKKARALASSLNPN